MCIVPPAMLSHMHPLRPMGVFEGEMVRIAASAEQPQLMTKESASHARYAGPGAMKSPAFG